MTFERVAVVLAGVILVALVVGVASEVSAAGRRKQLRERWQAAERERMVRTLREAADALEGSA